MLKRVLIFFEYKKWENDLRSIPSKFRYECICYHTPKIIGKSYRSLPNIMDRTKREILQQ